MFAISLVIKCTLCGARVREQKNNVIIGVIAVVVIAAQQYERL